MGVYHMGRKGEKNRNEIRRKKGVLTQNRKYWAKILGVRCMEHSRSPAWNPWLQLESLKKIEFL